MILKIITWKLFGTLILLVQWSWSQWALERFLTPEIVFNTKLKIFSHVFLQHKIHQKYPTGDFDQDLMFLEIRRLITSGWMGLQRLCGTLNETQLIASTASMYFNSNLTFYFKWILKALSEHTHTHTHTHVCCSVSVGNISVHFQTLVLLNLVCLIRFVLFMSFQTDWMMIRSLCGALAGVKTPCANKNHTGLLQLMAKLMFGTVNWYFILTHYSKR